MKPQFTVTKNDIALDGNSTPESLPQCLHNGNITTSQEIVQKDVETTFKCVASYGGTYKSSVAKITFTRELPSYDVILLEHLHRLLLVLCAPIFVFSRWTG